MRAVSERLTLQNPNGLTYRLPHSRAKTFRMEWQGDQPVFFGTMVDKLGAYEDIGTPDEFRELMKKSGQNRRKQKGEA